MQLPTEMISFFDQNPMSATYDETNFGIAIFAQVPNSMIRKLQNRVVIQTNFELVELEKEIYGGRWLLRIFDKPKNPYVIELFFNVSDEKIKKDFLSLLEQEDYTIVFVNENIEPVTTRTVPLENIANPNFIRELKVKLALLVLDEIPIDRFIKARTLWASRNPLV